MRLYTPIGIRRRAPTFRATRRVPLLHWLFVALATSFGAVPSEAQVTRADTADVILGVARTFEAEGRLQLAEELLKALAKDYANTPAGVEALSQVMMLQERGQAGRGQAGYVVWSTIFGAWLGIAVPAALGADEPEPFGVGLLLGAPTGFFASRAYGSAVGMTVGSSRVITYSWLWGSWQAMGWRAVLDSGTEVCNEFGCSVQTDDQAPWIAALAGGLGGYAGGVAASRAFDVSTGAAELLWHSSTWGTWYGFALGYLTDLEDDALLASALIGTNVGLVASIPASNAWRPTSTRVRLVSVAGLAGAVAGVGLDLLASVDDDKVAVAIPTIGATLGLIGGAILTAGDAEPPPQQDSPDVQAALLQIGTGVHLGIPAPRPVLRARLLPNGETEWDPGVALTLFQASF